MGFTALGADGATGNTVSKTLEALAEAVPEIESVTLSHIMIQPGDDVTATVHGNAAFRGVRLAVEKPDGSSFPARDVTGLTFQIDEFDASCTPGTYTLKFTALGVNGTVGNTVEQTIVVLGDEEILPVIEAVKLSATSIQPGDTIHATVTGNAALSGVRLKIETPDGSVLGERNEELSFDIADSDETIEPGAYTLTFNAVGTDGATGNTVPKTITVRNEESVVPAVPTFTMSQNTIYVKQSVQFTVQAPGATQVKLYVDGTYWENSNDTYSVVNVVAVFNRSFSVSGDREIQFCATIDGENWSELCPVQILTVKEHLAEINRIEARFNGEVFIGYNFTETAEDLEISLTVYCNDQASIVEAYIGGFNVESYVRTGEDEFTE